MMDTDIQSIRKGETFLLAGAAFEDSCSSCQEETPSRIPRHLCMYI